MTGEKLKVQLQPRCRDSQGLSGVDTRRNGGEIVTRERHAELEECNVEIR